MRIRVSLIISLIASIMALVAIAKANTVYYAIEWGMWFFIVYLCIGFNYLVVRFTLNRDWFLWVMILAPWLISMPFQFSPSSPVWTVTKDYTGWLNANQMAVISYEGKGELVIEGPRFYFAFPGKAHLYDKVKTIKYGGFLGDAKVFKKQGE